MFHFSLSCNENIQEKQLLSLAPFTPYLSHFMNTSVSIVPEGPEAKAGVVEKRILQAQVLTMPLPRAAGQVKDAIIHENTACVGGLSSF